jgi:hypothetical protein
VLLPGHCGGGSVAVAAEHHRGGRLVDLPSRSVVGLRREARPTRGHRAATRLGHSGYYGVRWSVAWCWEEKVARPPESTGSQQERTWPPSRREGGSEERRGRGQGGVAGTETPSTLASSATCHRSTTDICGAWL